MVFRARQRRGTFTPGDPHSGYYNDLTIKALDAGSPAAGVELAHTLTAVRERANPVTVAQLGLGAWQLSSDDARWLDTVDAVAAWLRSATDSTGAVTYRFSMPHTYPLRAPWCSAMAQGEIASLLVRAAASLARPELLEDARRAVSPLLDPSSAVVAHTTSGPALQEYPTDPPAHVLNGWIFALWGLYDVALAAGDADARAGFDAGVAALGARLPLYDTPWGWSRYDLFPHRIVHVTSPFYHALHVDQLDALALLAPRDELVRAADRWRSALRNPAALALAVGRKVAFRALEPRRPLP